MQNSKVIKEILYKISRRSTKDAEIILKSFCPSNLSEMSDRNLEDFLILLEQEDLDIFLWLQQPKKIPTPLKNNTILHKLIHTKIL